MLRRLARASCRSVHPITLSGLLLISLLQAVSVSGHSAQTIALALYTLSSFDFTGHVLNEFVQTTALPYLENDSPDVRQTAALTCSKLFVRDPICHQTSAHSIEIISDVLDKLLTVAVADPGKYM